MAEPEEVVAEVTGDIVKEETLTHEQKKEEEQAVIQRSIDETEAQMEMLDQMETEGGESGEGFNMQELLVSHINIFSSVTHCVSGHGDTDHQCDGVLRYNRTISSQGYVKDVQLCKKQ